MSAKKAMPKSISKHPTSYKLTDTALDIISTLSAKRGIAKSALIENLLRDAYRAEIERDNSIPPEPGNASKLTPRSNV